jgi:hypothetical protein
MWQFPSLFSEGPHFCSYSYLLKVEGAVNNFFNAQQLFSYFSLSNQTTFSQTQSGATVPLNHENEEESDSLDGVKSYLLVRLERTLGYGVCKVGGPRLVISSQHLAFLRLYQYYHYHYLLSIRNSASRTELSHYYFYAFSFHLYFFAFPFSMLSEC